MNDDEWIELSGDDGTDAPVVPVTGRVERTGIALVHEGEYVGPAPGSEAVVAPVWHGGEVTYTFPVEVEVIGQLSEDHLHRVAEYVFDELDTALRSRG